ncbi:hypothetical protein MACK_003294 [Theileria orientalis]|uniref:Uncharacterized protein n=1 Tax=Theileria orientalis TaxID=68886 RepID=A0A976SIF3_THEOR|nr:hypothetical protein MACK_003294 [Theileria orientalis]
MKTTLFVNLFVYLLFSSFNYAHGEDVFSGNDSTTADSEPQIPNSKLETFESYTYPNLQKSDIDSKTSKSNTNLGTTDSTNFPDELRFFTLIPNGERKVRELNRDQYTFKVDENNHELFHYEFSDNDLCAKIKYDDTTIWRSGDYEIEGAKFVIYNKNNDKIVVRDDERSITYRLVDDSPDHEDPLETAATEPDRTDSNRIRPLDSAFTYVAYLTDPVKEFRRSRITTDEFDYEEDDEYVTLTAKDNYAFNVVMEDNKEIWKTDKESEYATEVILNPKVKDNRGVKIQLPFGTKKEFNRQ